MFNDFLARKWKLIIYVINARLFHDLVYVVQALITLNEKLCINT